MGLALAATPEATRAPLPARMLARPLVVPVGWALATVRASSHAATQSRENELLVEGGLAPSWSLLAGLPVDASQGSWALASPGVGLRVGKSWEPEARSVSATLWHESPSGTLLSALHPASTLMLSARKRFGGLRATASVFGRVIWPSLTINPTDALGASAEALLQAGPLALTVNSTAEHTDTLAVSVGSDARIQWTRGVSMAFGPSAWVVPANTAPIPELSRGPGLRWTATLGLAL